jgi:YHS domain-containing protein
MKITISIILFLVAIFSMNCQPNIAKTGQQAAVSETNVSGPTKNIKTIGILLYDGYLDLEYDPQPPFKAGSEQNTDKEIVDMLRSMYDAGLAEISAEPKNASPAAQTAPHKHAQKPAQTAPVSATQNKIENKVDFICDMVVTPEFTDTCFYKGKLYAFCSAYCKEKFLETPEKFLQKK